MADVNVRKQQQEGGEKAVERRNERGLSRRAWDPFSFSLASPGLLSGDPFSVIRRLQHEMDRTLARFFGGEQGAESAAWSPAVEVAERDGKLHVRAELPGLKPEDVKVEITDDALVIQGEKKFEQEENKGGVYRSERRYGRFYREVPLPEGVSPEQAKAQFRDGVLSVELNMPVQKSNRRSIPIEGGSQSATSSTTGGGQK